MKFDRPVLGPSNAKRDPLENVYVGAHLLQARGASGGKWDRFGSADSEDAVTWNVLVGLLGDCDLVVPGAAPGLPGGELLLRDAAMLLWNVPVGSSTTHTRLERLLKATQRTIEANPRRPSEIEAVLWNEHLNRLAFVEAKLTAGPGTCSAVSSSPAVRKPDAECRMFRTGKRPRDNGCSYWGIGAGGDALSSRFPKDHVRAHLQFQPPVQGEEERAQCARLYQLMRNALIGREMADALAAQSSSAVDFLLVAIVAKGYFESGPYLEFSQSIKDPARVRFGVITWQDIRDELRQSNCQPDVAEYLENHTRL